MAGGFKIMSNTTEDLLYDDILSYVKDYGLAALLKLVVDLVENHC